MQTNHHCARGCIQQLSTPTKDFIASGFYAREEADEVKCPDVEVNQLISITDVTERVNRAIAGKEGRDFNDALKAERASIARECSSNEDDIRCDVVSLYNGGVYNLYKYRRYQDVRLVFAPEVAIAFVGGDPDNFEFPRYCLDVSYMRVYSNGRPLDSSANFLPYAKADVQPGDLTFTSGHPGSTSRLDTVAELEFQRDVVLPRSIFEYSELRGMVTEFAKKGAEQARISNGMLFGIENGLKAMKGHFFALVDSAIIKNHAAAEQAMRARIAADPGLKARYSTVWDDIGATVQRSREKRDGGVISGGFYSSLFGYALTLVRYPAEAAKSDEFQVEQNALVVNTGGKLG